MKKHKLLFGICGIGRGHIYRQLPIISHFEKNCMIAIFAFEESYIFFKNLYRGKKNIRVFKVFVPWIHGGTTGIDYSRTAQDPFNQNALLISQNFAVMDAALKWLGRPNLIISDYEPISAQYSYSLNTPLIIIDQQSKYFYTGYPKRIAGLAPTEERARLNLFFPKANARIACSFFRPPSKNITQKNFKILIASPVIREEILRLKTNKRCASEHILVYLSPYSSFTQSADEVLAVLEKFPKYFFHLFVSKKSDFSKIKNRLPRNINIDFHGNNGYLDAVNQSEAAICTAGHTFISEMMFLFKPVYAVPLQTYEQKYNAKIIDDNEFGIARHKINFHSLRFFLSNIERFNRNIRLNNKILLNKQTGQTRIINFLNKTLKSSYEN